MAEAQQYLQRPQASVPWVLAKKIGGFHRKKWVCLFNMYIYIYIYYIYNIITYIYIYIFQVMANCLVPLVEREGVGVDLGNVASMDMRWWTPTACFSGWKQQFYGDHVIQWGYKGYIIGISCTMWGRPVISWFRFAPVTIVISTINHSYWSYLHQLSYLGGLTL